jgi:hypothetical protein
MSTINQAVCDHAATATMPAATMMAGAIHLFMRPLPLDSRQMLPQSLAAAKRTITPAVAAAIG